MKLRRIPGFVMQKAPLPLLVLVVLFSLVSPLVTSGTASALGAPPAPPSSRAPGQRNPGGDNILWDIAYYCHDLSDYNNTPSGAPMSCQNMQDVAKSALGCGNMFYKATFHTDPTDNSVTKSLWYTDPGVVKDCYNKAYNTINQINSTCAGIRRNPDSPNWSNVCEPDQNKLHDALGCSPTLYESGHPDKNHWGPKLADLENCNNRAAQVGGAQIVIPDTSGIGVKTKLSGRIDSSSVTATTQPGGGGSGGGTDSSPPGCEASGFSLSWIFCPIIEGLANATDGIYSSLIKPMLQTKPISTSNDAGDPTHLYEIWSNFRVYGDVFLVIALLVIVFGESIGGGVIDAYAAKKILPRLLIAAVLINLSIYLVALAVDVTNILGNGIAALIQAPFNITHTFDIHIGGATGDLGMVALLTLIGAAWVGKGPLLMFLLIFVGIPIFLTLIAILLTVVLRQGLIVLLVLLSPVAFALYCLPNTEKYFRQWWDLLWRTLLVYPLIAVFFAMGNVLSVTINSTASGITGAFTALLSTIALFVPLFLIPFSFRIAGGLLGRFHEFATTSRKRAHEGFLGNANDANSLRNRTKRRLGAQYTAAESRAINAAKGPNAGFFQRRRAGLINALDGRVNERQSRYTRDAGELANLISSTGNDDDHYAAGYFSFGAGHVVSANETGLKDGNGNPIPVGTTFASERFFDSKGREINGAYARRSASKLARNQHEAGRALEYPVRKVQTDDDIANFRRGFAATALRQGWTEGEMNGVLAASVFEHKDKFPELWYEKPRYGTDPATGQRVVTWDDSSRFNHPDPVQRQRDQRARAGATGELHKTRESFRLSSVRDSLARSWDTGRNSIQATLDTGAPISEEDARFYAQTNEILDSAIQRGYITRDGDDGPQMASSGASPAMQGVLRAMQRNRKYETTAAINPSGTASVNERVIYNSEQVKNDIAATIPRDPSGKPTGPPTLSQDAAIAARAAQINTSGGAVTDRIDVTGDADRSTIPRQTP